MRAATLSKKRLRWHRCFPVRFTIFLRAPFFQNTTGQLFCPDRSRLNCELFFLWKVVWGLWTSITKISFLCYFGPGRSRQRCTRLFSCKKMTKSRSSRSQMFFKKGVVKNFAIFSGKYLRWSLSLMKLLCWRPVTLWKRDCNTGVFLWIMRNS